MTTRLDPRAAARPDPLAPNVQPERAADTASRTLPNLPKPPTVADAAKALRATWDVYRSAYTLACERGHGPELAQDHDALIALILVQAKALSRQR